jgi:hypothetical protein
VAVTLIGATSEHGEREDDRSSRKSASVEAHEDTSFRGEPHGQDETAAAANSSASKATPMPKRSIRAHLTALTRCVFK